MTPRLFRSPSARLFALLTAILWSPKPGHSGETVRYRVAVSPVQPCKRSVGGVIS